MDANFSPLVWLACALNFAAVPAIAAADSLPPPDGIYSAVQRVMLSPEVRTTTHLDCMGGVDGCQSDASELHQFDRSGGAIEIWEDSRLTAALRRKLWGQGGIVMAGGRNDPMFSTFYQRNERNALVVLRNAAGDIVDLKVLDRYMAEVREPVLVRPPIRTYLLAVDTSGPSVRSGVTGMFLDVDSAKGQLSFERYAAPNSILITYPTGVTLHTPWRPYGDLTIPPNGQFEVWAAGAGPARFRSSSCEIDSYTDPKTKEYVYEIGNETISGQLQGPMWRQSVRVDFRSCQNLR